MFNWRIPFTALLFIAVPALLHSCGNDSKTEDPGPQIVVSGEIVDTDSRDPDHSGLLYDPVIFDASLLDHVRVEVEASDFQPLLKLIECSTGAVLAEWDPMYAEDDALEYTIALTGAYEARVYSFDGASGEYTVRITISR